MAVIAEQQRLLEAEARSTDWRRWGPYLSERQWGTVREDYSPDGTAWDYFPHDHARSRAYRWGPVWFPVNFLLVESLQKFHHFFGDSLKVACPSGSDRLMNLWEVAAELSQRLAHIFLPGPDGRTPVYGGTEIFQRDPHWRGLIPFHEYFHGDNGAGIGASHQTGWTGLVAKLLQQSGE